MSDRIRCFLLEPTGLADYELRRFSMGEARCPGNQWRMGCHVARRIIGRGPVHAGNVVWTPANIDERWPLACDCGYEFRPEDYWQANDEHLYKRSDTGELVTLRSAAVGAIWRADWYEGLKGHGGPDGKVYVCRVPGGADWVIDGPASNAPDDRPGWTRTGTPPQFTARPSIQAPGWHGYLTDGELHP